MKAVVLTPERDLDLRQVAEPSVGAGEVLVRSEYCGICGTDLHAGELEVFREGVVLGHEFAGEIVAVADDVRTWSVGQRVTANPNGHICGVCRQCRAGRYNLCRVATQERPLGVARDGGLAEYVALHTSYLHALPEGMETRRGAWVEPLAVAVRAVRTSPVKVGDAVAVIGGGPVGQLAVQVLRHAGVGRLLIVEPSRFRRDVALRMGADEAPTPEELSACLGEGATPEVDHVLECSGHPTAVQTAVELVAPGGSIRLVGMSPRPPSFDASQMIMKELHIIGGFIYVEEFAQAIGLLAAGAIDVEVLTSAVMPLEEYAEAFATLREPEQAVKVLIQTAPGRTAAGERA